MCKEEKIIKRTIDTMFSKLLNAFAKKNRKEARQEIKQKEFENLIEELKLGKEVNTKDLEKTFIDELNKDD